MLDPPLGPPLTPSDNPFCEKSNPSERERKMPLKVYTYFRAAHANRPISIEN
jgi:hypothetical protein